MGDALVTSIATVTRVSHLVTPTCFVTIQEVYAQEVSNVVAVITDVRKITGVPKQTDGVGKDSVVYTSTYVLVSISTV